MNQTYETFSICIFATDIIANIFIEYMNIWKIAHKHTPTRYTVHLPNTLWDAGQAHMVPHIFLFFQMSGMSVISSCLSVDLLYFLQGVQDNPYTPAHSPRPNICLLFCDNFQLDCVSPMFSECVCVLFLTLLSQSIRAQPHACVMVPRWFSETGREREWTDSLYSWQRDEEKRVGYVLMFMSFGICHGYLSCFSSVKGFFFFNWLRWDNIL